MTLPRLRTVILLVSLGINLAALTVAGIMIQKRGGLPWALHRLGMPRAVVASNQPRSAPALYQARVALLRELPVPRHAVLMLGASLVQRGEWRELFPEVTILNRGVSGDTTVGAAARVTAYLANQPRKIFVLIGTNDLMNNQSVTDTILRYDQLLTVIRRHAPRSDLYVQALPPCAPLPTGTVPRFNRQLAGVAQRHAAVFIDTYTPFLTSTGQIRDELFLNDGIHLSAAGYLLWRDILRPWMHSAPQQTPPSP